MPDAISRAVVWLRISPQTPLLLGNKSGVGNYQFTEEYIPGSMLRGAVAKKLLDNSQKAFDTLFGGDEPYFGNGYLGGSGPVWPFPLTARTCKRYPGLSSGTTEDNKKYHGVVDMLAADFAYGLISDVQFPQRENLQPNGPQWDPLKLPNVRTTLDQCPICKVKAKEEQSRLDDGSHDPDDTKDYPMQPATGYYTWAGQSPLKVTPAQTMRTTHVGINRARGVAQDQLLFTQEKVVVQNTSDAFFARISVPVEKLGVFQEAIEGILYVGRGRSRGNGRVFVEIEPVDATLSLNDRLFNFRLRLSAALAFYKQDSKVLTELPGTFFSVTLRSPAILHIAGRPQRVPAATSLGLTEADNISCIRAWARTAIVGGWDSAAMRPRRKALAAAIGSVYLFWADGTVDQERLEAELTRAELNGLGEDRERGYGQFTVCAPFHYSAWD